MVLIAFFGLRRVTDPSPCRAFPAGDHDIPKRAVDSRGRKRRLSPDCARWRTVGSRALGVEHGEGDAFVHPTLVPHRVLRRTRNRFPEEGPSDGRGYVPGRRSRRVRPHPGSAGARAIVSTRASSYGPPPQTYAPLSQRRGRSRARRRSQRRLVPLLRLASPPIAAQWTRHLRQAPPLREAPGLRVRPSMILRRIPPDKVQV
jgi:hypothetical protein